MQTWLPHDERGSLRLEMYVFREGATALIWNPLPACRLRVTQNARDRRDCVPIPRRHLGAKQFINLPKVSDCLHVPAVLSEDELPIRRDEPHQPFAILGKRNRQGRPGAIGFRQNVDETNDTRLRRLSSKGILVQQAGNVAAFAQVNISIEWKLAEQFGSELHSVPGIPDDKGPRGAHVHHSIGAQFLCADAWAELSVPADIHTSEKND